MGIYLSSIVALSLFLRSDTDTLQREFFVQYIVTWVALAIGGLTLLLSLILLSIYTLEMFKMHSSKVIKVFEAEKVNRYKKKKKLIRSKLQGPLPPLQLPSSLPTSQ